MVIDYRTEDVVARIKAATGGVDHVVDVDFGKNIALTAQVLRPNGVVTSYASMGDPKPALPYYDLFALNPVLRPVLVYTMNDDAKAQAHADIARWSQEPRRCSRLPSGLRWRMWHTRISRWSGARRLGMWF